MSASLAVCSLWAVTAAPAGAATTPPSYLAQLGIWATVPFVLMLLLVALMPVVAPHFWERNTHRGCVALALGAPTLALCAQADAALAWHTLHEYVAFVVLLTSLYVVAGGVHLQVSTRGGPKANVAWLLVGAVLASIVGTTGASMLLIRPFLTGLKSRTTRAHAVVAFIFVVSNAGGLLTPLGDPPLFLGFLRGVPFLWTFKLWGIWAVTNGLLIAGFAVLDAYLLRRDRRVHTPADTALQPHVFRLEGMRNVGLLAALVAWIALSGFVALPLGAPEMGLVGIAALSWWSTDQETYRRAGFDWAPMQEVAILFAGIFATMPPALSLLAAHGASLGLERPWQYFWCTGLLSSVLDNAPTYLTFTAAASAVMHTHPGHLEGLIDGALGERLLTAISAGAVLMGAMTYVGNGPNLMVRAVADAQGIAMPSFLKYTCVALGVLTPIFGVVTYLFVVG